MSTKPDAPKRPINATFAYIHENRKAYSLAHPNLKLTEITSKLSEQYKSISEKEREKYDKAYSKAREEYEKVGPPNLGQESLRGQAWKDRGQEKDQGQRRILH